MTLKHPVISCQELTALLAPIEVVLNQPEDLYSFLTDSRSLASASGTAFLAIRTASGNGHFYIPELYQRGVRTFIVEESISRLVEACPEANFLRVSSTIGALQSVAEAHRQRFTLPVLGITGSNGKTTVKEYLNILLGPEYRICRSPRSYNSQIGVPLSVLQLSEQANLGIFEAGISMPGEMQRLERIIRPTLGVLTSIGSAHEEHFVSRAELLREKLSLFIGAEHIVAPLDIPELDGCLESLGLLEHTVGWSRLSSAALLYIVSEDRRRTETLISAVLAGNHVELIIPFADSASIDNVLTALCVVYLLRGKLERIVLERIKELRPLEMRLEIKESYRGNTLINDAYSNDIAALRIALDTLRRRSTAVGALSVAVISDIEESAMPTETLYHHVAQLLEEFGINKVYAVGHQVVYLQKFLGAYSLVCFSSTEALLSSGLLQRLESACILIKGARSFGFERIYRELSRLEHQTMLEVNLSAIRHNLAYYRSLLPHGHAITCMIKANGYGMGDFELARTLEEAHVDYLAVATADEAKALRQRGIRSRIMVMNPDGASVDTLVRYDLEPEVYSLDLLSRLITYAERRGLQHFPVHLKVDSGMHRLGFSLDELPEVLHLLGSTSGVYLRSVFSHLASADEARFDEFTRAQAAYLQRAHALVWTKLGYRPILHLLNTSGIVRFAAEFSFDMVRLGIGLYGVSPVEGEHALQEVCQLSTTILQVKDIGAGEPVGYGCSESLEGAARIAVIPIGYADGLRRALGRGRWSVLVNGHLCPTVGNICMDACMIDVTKVPGVKAGDKVMVFGGDALSVSQLAECLDTIPYEILTSLSPRIQRLYLQD